MPRKKKQKDSKEVQLSEGVRWKSKETGKKEKGGRGQSYSGPPKRQKKKRGVTGISGPLPGDAFKLGFPNVKGETFLKEGPRNEA